MGNLLRELPGFASDFTGVSSLVSSMGGMGIIHAPVGCIGNYTGFDEPTWFTEPGMIFSSSMRETEAIFGDEDTLIDKIVRTAEVLKPPFITVIGAPPAALIGSDYYGIASTVEKQTGMPTIGVDTNGFGFYREGMEKFLSQMVRFIKPPEKDGKGVNILGYTHLDYYDGSDLNRLKTILKNEGETVNCSVGNCTLNEFSELCKAEKNIVVSSGGLSLAKYLKKTYGMPYTCQLPIGGTFSPHNNCNGNSDILIIGDQIISNSVRNFIRERYGRESDVCTFFGFDRELASPNDVPVTTEKEIKSIIGKDYDVIIGDPLFEKFTSGKYIGIPHEATSSRLFWNSHTNLFGNGIVEILDRHFTSV